MVLPKFIIQSTIGDITRLAGRAANLTPFYTAVEENLITLDTLDDIKKKRLLAEAEAAIDGSVLPAYHG